MKKVFLIVVGKNKTDALVKEEHQYLKRIKAFKLETIELKHFDSKEKNDDQVIQKINSISGSQTPKVILLEETGELQTSTKFSKEVFGFLESSSGPVIFVIGGAEGHGDEIKKFTRHHLSLSKMTLPHRFARLVLIEQLYRAETINTGHPYHK